MIIQKDNTNFYVWVNNKEAQLNNVLSEFKLLDSNTQPSKHIQIHRNGQYMPKGATTPLASITVLAKDKAIFIMNDMHRFSLLRNDARALASALNRFGVSTVDINGKSIKGPFSAIDSRHLKTGSKNIALGQFINNSIESKVDQFIHRMKTDNGKMLLPLTRKFTDMLHLLGKNRNRLSGYVDLNLYLRMLNQPTLNTESVIKDLNTADYLLNIPQEQTHAVISVAGVDASGVKLVLKSPSVLYDGVESLPQKNPYLMFTPKPLSLKDEQFPFFVLSYKGHRVFVTAMIMDNSSPFESLSGGVNLLK